MDRKDQGYIGRTACVVPTLNGKQELRRLLNSLACQSVPFDLLIVDSGSNDGSAEVGAAYATHFKSIEKKHFGHGRTRQMMVEAFPDYDFYVFLTQDCILSNSDSLRGLLSPFEMPSIGAVYGRQLPHADANVFAQHARLFNYPLTSSRRSKKDIEAMGISAAFMSNSFGAYRRQALTSVGGFARHLAFGEDMQVAARMLLGDWEIFYTSQATAHHSHNYTLAQEFARYFEIGVFHKSEADLFASFKGLGKTGLRYQISELQYLGLSKSYLWPISILRNISKLIARFLGKVARSKS